MRNDCLNDLFSSDSRNFIEDVNIFVSEISGTCAAKGGGNRRIQGFGGETRRKETTGETQA
jgi:hypothetical protein